MNKDNKVPWLFFLMAPIAFLIITFKDWLSANQLMLPAVITLFVAVFGILLVYGLK